MDQPSPRARSGPEPCQVEEWPRRNSEWSSAGLQREMRPRPAEASKTTSTRTSGQSFISLPNSRSSRWCTAYREEATGPIIPEEPCRLDGPEMRILSAGAQQSPPAEPRRGVPARRQAQEELQHVPLQEILSTSVAFPEVRFPVPASTTPSDDRVGHRSPSLPWESPR